jgi:hypothetical protein
MSERPAALSIKGPGTMLIEDQDVARKIADNGGKHRKSTTNMIAARSRRLPCWICLIYP